MEESDTSAFDESTVDAAQAADIIWVFFCLVLVTLMQPGFACYEVGAVSGASSIQPILLKNIGDASVSLIAWWLTGYAFASGKDAGGFIGYTYFFFTGNAFVESPDQSAAKAFLECLYQWSFAAACTTIVSGAVADRIPFQAYIVYAFLTSAFFYPVLAHWVWADEGWLSAARDDPLLGCGVLDFAGSGVVHMCGGGIGLFIARKVESRYARFFPATHHDWDEEESEGTKLKNHTDRPQIQEAAFSSNDLSWMTLGGFLLWIGWYGFNCGSTLEISTIKSQRAAGRAAMNTTIAAAFGCIFSMIVELLYHLNSPAYRRGDDIEDPLHFAPIDWDAKEADDDDLTPSSAKIKDVKLDLATLRKIKDHRRDHRVDRPWGQLFGGRDWTWPYSTHINLHGAAVNGILAGLVGITAGCATMGNGSAIGVSFVSVLLYHVFYRGFICSKIDDSVGAGALHFVCGAWGLLAAGFTGTEAARIDAGYPSMDVCSRGSQTLLNFAAMIGIIIYAFVCTLAIWGLISGVPGLLERAQRGQRHIKPVDSKLEEFRKNVIRQDAVSSSERRELRKQIDELKERLAAGVSTN